MTNRTPQFELPSAALHAPTHREPHIDSEESVRYERRRVSRELEPIFHHESSRQSSEAPQTSEASPNYASLRSRIASTRDSSTSRAHLRRNVSATSDASTQLDSPGASEDGGRSSRTSIRVPHWYDPATKFWRTHISITIDEGAHRDHLGMISQPHLLNSHRRSDLTPD